MNVFKRELYAYRKALLFWSLGMIALVASGMGKYSAYQSTGESIVDVIAKFPHAVQIIFGTYGFNLATASGFYGVLFLYIALMATLHAVLLGCDLLAKEEQDKTTEFLYVKPLSRQTIVTEKLLAGFCNLVVLNLITGISSIVTATIVSKGSSVDGYIVQLMGALFILQMLFFSIGAAVAGRSRQPKASAAISTSSLLSLFVLAYIIDFNTQLSFLKYLTPFRYFDAATILNSNHVDIVSILLGLLLSAFGILATYAFYTKRDLKV